MYDNFSSDYDRFVDWPARLAVELPFIERELQVVGARRVLDAACGTGMHALALASRGYDAVGADISGEMIAVARAHAVRAGVEIPFEVASFGHLQERLGNGFDALLCLGNSLPHLPGPDPLACALADFWNCLRPGGLLLIQNRNFDAVLARRDRWMDPQSHVEGGEEWVFLRFYDFQNDGTIAFHVVTLRRQEDGPWTQGISTTTLWPIRRDELGRALDEAGFGEQAWYGDMQGRILDADNSPNLVATARRT